MNNATLKKFALGVSLLAGSTGVSFGIFHTLYNSENSPDPVGIEGTAPNVSDQTIRVTTSLDYRPARSVDEMSLAAEIILTGTVEKIAGVVNTARNPDDPAKAHSQVYGLGRLYQINVESYEKGNGPPVVTVVQVESYFEWSEAEPEVQADPSKRATDANIEPMRPGSTYKLFLRHWPSRPELLVPASEPYRFLLDGKKPQLEGRYKESSQAFGA